MTEVLIIETNPLIESMDWLLYDRDLRHERVNVSMGFGIKMRLRRLNENPVKHQDGIFTNIVNSFHLVLSYFL